MHVERPRIAVRDLSIADVRTNGVVLRVALAAYNPNPFDLPMRDLDAVLTVGAERTPAHVDHLDTVLPPMREIPVDVNVLVPWGSLPGLVQSARNDALVAYHLEGDITVHHYIDVRSHFVRDGTIPRDELNGRARAAIGSFLRR